MKSEITVREARKEDLDDIFILEKDSFESGWTRENLEKEMVFNFSIMLVAEADGAVIGFITAWLIRGEIQINRLAVEKKYRRMGAARNLLAALVTRSSGGDPFRILLEVREKNEAARAFYRSMGFIETGVRKGYYRDDNAVLLDKDLSL